MLFASLVLAAEPPKPAVASVAPVAPTSTDTSSKHTIRFLGGVNTTQWNSSVEGLQVHPEKSPALSVGYMRKRPLKIFRYGLLLDYRSIFARERADGGSIIESNYLILAPRIELAFPIFRPAHVIVAGLGTNYMLASKSNLTFAGRNHEIKDADHEANRFSGLNVSLGIGNDLNLKFNWRVELNCRLNRDLTIFGGSAASSLFEILAGGDFEL